MSGCVTCSKPTENVLKAKLEKLKPTFYAQAMAAGLTEFAILRTVNINPAFMWRPLNDEACGRLGIYEICIIAGTTT